MLGVDLSRELDKDYEVIGLDIIRNPLSSVKHYYKADITDRKQVGGVVKKVKPDILIHTAAWTDVDGCEREGRKAYKINSEGTKNIALACKKAGTILFYISTDFVFDGRKSTPYAERDKTKPISLYGDSKLRGELNGYDCRTT